MLHSGCVKLHQKFRDFVGLPMGLLREESPKNRMNTGLFGSRSGEYGLKAARRAPQFSKRGRPDRVQVLYRPPQKIPRPNGLGIMVEHCPQQANL